MLSSGCAFLRRPDSSAAVVRGEIPCLVLPAVWGPRDYDICECFRKLLVRLARLVCILCLRCDRGRMALLHSGEVYHGLQNGRDALTHLNGVRQDVDRQVYRPATVDLEVERNHQLAVSDDLQLCRRAVSE